MPVMHDRYGDLRRSAKMPAYSFPTVLKRRYATYYRRAQRVAAAERLVQSARKQGDQNCLKTAYTVLGRAIASRDLTMSGIEAAVRGIRERTVSFSKHVKSYRVGDAAKIAERFQDVVDTAEVRAGGSEATPALLRLEERYGAQIRYRIYQYGKHFDEDEGRARIQEALWRAARTWQWDHPSLAQFSTCANLWAVRCLQKRTKADCTEAENAVRDTKGERTVVTMSVVQGGQTGEDSYEPIISPAKTGQPATLKEATEAEEQRRRIDAMHKALASLADVDREILERIGCGEPKSRVAAEMKMSLHEVMGRFSAAAAAVREGIG